MQQQGPYDQLVQYRDQYRQLLKKQGISGERRAEIQAALDRLDAMITRHPQTRWREHAPKDDRFVVLMETAGKTRQARDRAFAAVADAVEGRLVDVTSSANKSWLLLEVDSNKDIAAVKRSAGKMAGVRAISPNWTLSTHWVEDTSREPREPHRGKITRSTNIADVQKAAVDDPLYLRQWDMHNNGSQVTFGQEAVEDADVNAPEAWQVTTGSRDVVVAVIDTGVAYNHPDLAPNMWTNPGEIPGNGIDDDGNGYVDDIHGYNMIYGHGDPHDDGAHGTHVAGVIGAVGGNGIGIAGLNHQVSIMAVKIFDDYGFGQLFDAVQAINYAVANGANIMNASWGFPYDDNGILRAAVQDAADAGVLLVVAAGNDSNRIDWDMSASFPAGLDLPNILAVAADEMDADIAIYSSYGTRRVHLAAPGSDVLSTWPGREVIFSYDFDDVPVGELPDGFSTSEEVLGVVAAERRGGLGNHALRPHPILDGHLAAGDEVIIDLPPLDANGIVGQGIYLDFDFASNYASKGRLYIDQLLNGEWILLNQGFQDGFLAGSHPADEGYFRASIYVPVFKNDSLNMRFRWVASEPTSNTDEGYIEIDNLRLYRDDWANPDADYSVSYEVISGTSMAAPHVSGAAALLMARFPDITLDELKMRLALTGKQRLSLLDKTITARSLDVAAALTASGPLALLKQPVDGVPHGHFQVMNYSFFDQPSTPLTVFLMKEDQIVATIVENHVGDGMLTWFVPEVTPDTYYLRLQAADQSVDSQPFSITSTDYVTMPDSAWRDLALSNFDLNGDNRFSTFELEDYDGPIYIENRPDITTAEGIQYLKNATLLVVFNSGVTELPDLNETDISFLYVDTAPLRTIGGLPAGASTVYFDQTHLRRLDGVPHNLSELVVTNSPLEYLDALPENGSTVMLSGTRLSDLPDGKGYLFILEYSAVRDLDGIDAGIWNLTANPYLELPDFAQKDAFFISLRGMGLTSMPSIPEDLHSLDVRFNQITEIDALPVGLDDLDASFNQIRSFTAPVSSNLTQLNLAGNLLRNLPEWSPEQKFDALILSRNLLSSLPETSGARFLDLSHNLFSNLDSLPSDVRELNISANRLTRLPELPVSLRELYASGNMLLSLPEMPEGLRFLDLSNNMLGDLGALEGLDELLFLDLAENLIEDITPLCELESLREVDVNGNLLDETDAEAIQTMLARDLYGRDWYDNFRTWLASGLPYFETDGYAGFRYQWQNGGLLRLDGAVAQELVRDLSWQRLEDGSALLHWAGGGNNVGNLSAYLISRVNPDKELVLGTSTSTNFRVTDLVAGPNSYRITPVDEDRQPLGEGQIVTVDVVTPLTQRYTYYLPRPPQEGEWLALALTNTTPDEVILSISKYDEDGNVGAVSTLILGAGAKDKRVLDLVDQNANEHYVIEASGPLHGVVLTGRDGSYAAGQLLTDHLYQNGTVSFDAHNGIDRDYSWWENSIYLVNPGVDNAWARVSVTYWAGNEVLDQQEFGIMPRGRLSGNPLISSVKDLDTLTRVTWSSDTQLATAMYSKHQDHPLQALDGHGNTSAALQGWLPVSGNYLSIENPNGVPVDVTITVLSKRGITHAIEHVYVAPGETGLYDASFGLYNMRGLQTTSPGEDWVQFSASSPVFVAMKTDGAYLGSARQRGLGGWLVGGALATTSASERIPATTEAGAFFTVPHVTYSREWQTELVIANAGNSTRGYEVRGFDEAGNLIGRYSGGLGAGERDVLDGETLLGAAGLPKAGNLAYLTVAADDELAELVTWVTYYTNLGMERTMVTLPIVPETKP